MTAGSNGAGVRTMPEDPAVIFLFGGVGTHGQGTDLSGLSSTPLYGEVAELVQELHGESLEAYLQAHLTSTKGEHTATITTIINMLHGSAWRACRQEPTVVVGHSVGEVAAAHAAGMITTRQVNILAHTHTYACAHTHTHTHVDNHTYTHKYARQALTCALALGKIAATQAGGMLYTVVDDVKKITADDGLFMSGLSYADEHGARVTVSGPVVALDQWLATDAQAVRIPSAHPWHHPLYASTPTEALPATSSPNVDRSCVFVSAVGGGRVFGPEDCLDEHHWRAWLTEPNSLDSGLRAAAGLVHGPGTAVLIECGAHPTARSAARTSVQPLVHVASMHRDVPAFAQLQVLTHLQSYIIQTPH
jgi:acyl transferase domain-containing protein